MRRENILSAEGKKNAQRETQTDRIVKIVLEFWIKNSQLRPL